jgi:hypothetical protein
VRPTVNTFDVFDTLIARRCVESHGVLARLEEQACLIKALTGRVGADPHLPAIYTGHREADEAYVREIFAAHGE